MLSSWNININRGWSILLFEAKKKGGQISVYMQDLQKKTMTETTLPNILTSIYIAAFVLLVLPVLTVFSLAIAELLT